MKLYFYCDVDDSENICMSPIHPTWEKSPYGNKWWFNPNEISICARNARKFLRASKAKNVTRAEHLTMVQIVQGKITTNAWEAIE